MPSYWNRRADTPPARWVSIPVSLLPAIATLDAEVVAWIAEHAALSAAHHSASAQTPTFVVAASGSIPSVQAAADYICDGVADDVQIQAALDALPAAGGRVVLSEGQFNLAAPVHPSGDGQVLSGQGNGAGTDKTAPTALYLSDGVGGAMLQKDAAATRYSFKVERMRLDGNLTNNPGGTYGIDMSGMGIHVDQVTVTRTKSHGVFADKTGEVNTWSAITNAGVNSCEGDGVHLVNLPSAVYLANIVCDQNLNGFYLENTTSIEAVRLSSGSNSQYGYRLKDCLLMLIRGMYSEANGIGPWFEGCQRCQVDGLYSVDDGVGDKGVVSITGTVWTPAGEGLSFNGVFVNTSGASVVGVWIDGAHRGQLGAVLLTLDGANVRGFYVKNAGDLSIEFSAYVPNLLVLVDTSGGGNTRLAWRQLNGAAGHVFPQTVTLKNGVNASFEALRLDAGEDAPQNAIMRFADQGVDKWAIYKDDTNGLRIYSNVAGGDVLRISPEGIITVVNSIEVGPI